LPRDRVHAKLRRVGAIAIAGVLGSVAVGAALASGISIRFARRVVTPPRRRDEPIVIRGVGAGTITVSSNPDTRLSGDYGLFFAGGTGHARVGGIQSQTRETVTRSLLGVDAGDLASARRARFSGWFFQDPSDLGVDFEAVTVPTELGAAPAWLVPAAADSGDWVIQVHGRGARRGECLRAIPVFREAGFTSLLISYRNDGDAPSSRDRRYGLGVTERRDVDSAVHYAIARGATRIVLMGWSMGGATVLQSALDSGRPSVIRGVILDSPVADWAATVEFHGRLLRVPRAARWGAAWILRSSASRLFAGTEKPIDFAALDVVGRAAELNLPVLLMHSKQDGYVPFAPAAALARARPDLIRFEVFTRARHTKLWNYDPERWDAAIRDWIATVIR